jgi:hypothetical protein
MLCSDGRTYTYSAVGYSGTDGTEKVFSQPDGFTECAPHPACLRAVHWQRCLPECVAGHPVPESDYLVVYTVTREVLLVIPN